MFCLPKSALLKTVYSLSRTFTHTSQWRLFRTPSVILSVAYSSSSYQCNNEVAAGSSKNINMNMLPDVSSVAGGSTGFTIPEEAYLKGWELVNKRATNMVYTVFGEKPMTKMLQIGGSTSFIDALGKVCSFFMYWVVVFNIL